MRLILAGTEQPNLHVLEALRAGRLRPGDVLVVGSTTWRSPAMLPGLVAGRYHASDVTVDVAALAGAAGARHVEAAVTAVDANARTITLDGGRVEPWDLLSLSVPLTPAMPDPGVSPNSGVRTQPWSDVDAVLRDLDLVRQASNGRGISIAVVGAGTAGFEVACALASRLDGKEPRVSIRVVDADAGVLADREPASRRLATRSLLTQRIGLALGARVEALTARGLRLASGAAVPADLVIWCTGAVAPAILAGSGLARDPRGFADVDGTLRSTSHPEVFVTSRPDLFREGNVLAHNLAVASGALPGKPFRTRRAPTGQPAILYSGGDSAIVSFGSMAREAGWALRLKDRLDRRFIERFRKA